MVAVGYKEMVLHLKVSKGIDLEWKTLYRWARRSHNPPPVRILRPDDFSRGRAVAYLDELERWADTLIQPMKRKEAK